MRKGVADEQAVVGTVASFQSSISPPSRWERGNCPLIRNHTEPVANRGEDAMFLSDLTIEGYKGFREPFTVSFQKGLNVLVGENASGKTTAIDAVRLLLMEDEFGHAPLDDTDFHQPFDSPKEVAKQFRLHGIFSGLSDEEHVAFLPWTDLNDHATLTLLVENKTNNKGRYKPVRWGGASRASMFESELFDAINCIYLPPLRDAESKLREGKSSRLARLLKNLNRKSIEEARSKGAPLSIERRVEDFNKAVCADKEEAIAKANQLIRGRLIAALGTVFGQDTRIRFAEVNFNRIVESLRLLFFPRLVGGEPEEPKFRSLEENSLGYNNLLYLATVLAELTEQPDSLEYFKVLLIEEPEAHLHPQLLIRVLKYLEKTATDRNVQIIVTTHSPVLASSVSLETLIHLSCAQGKPQAVPLRECGLQTESAKFVSRWLDVTKSVLLFAKGVILVEGIAEAMLLPELAKIIMRAQNEKEAKQKKVERTTQSGGTPDDLVHPPACLEDAGIAVINMNGVYFKHFMQLFADVQGGQSSSIPVRCAGITDTDPPKESKPTLSNPINGENPALELVANVKATEWARLYPGPLKTFEYDLAMEGNNIRTMAAVLRDHWPIAGTVKDEIGKLVKDWTNATEAEKADAAFKLLTRIEDRNMGKGMFAQLLAEHISKGNTVAIPEYIKKAVIWACGGTPDEPTGQE
jgi:predicted ATP-dependent endonuclease of OLD family